MLEISLLILVVFSIAAIQTRSMRNAVIYLGAFSLCISFVYLLYNAPDVAIAEAIIGSTISTILYLVALQKYKIFTIFINTNIDIKNDNFDNSVIKLLNRFCNKHELESQFIFSTLSLEDIFKHHQYALILETSKDYPYLTIYAHSENFKLEALEILLNEKYKEPYIIKKIEEDISE